MAHDRKPGPPGNAPSVMKKTPMYRMFAFFAQRKIAKPVIPRSVKAARKIPRRFTLSEKNATAIATTQAHTYGGTEYNWAFSAFQPNSFKIVGYAR